MTINVDELIYKFKDLFDTKVHSLYFAPGRINLIGEHLDYNGGHVFPGAINLGTLVLLSLREDKKVQCYSVNMAEEGLLSFNVNETDYDEKDGWMSYVKGMFHYLFEGKALPDKGFNLLVYGNIPNGAGLSSSASLELAAGAGLNDLYRLDYEKIDLAKLGQRVENEFIGINTGIMDQLAIAMGQENQALYLNTATLDVDYVPADFGNYKILIMNTNKRRELVESKYNTRRRECEAALAILQKHIDINYLTDLSSEDFAAHIKYLKDPVLVQRVQHVVSEENRTKKTKEVLNRDDLKAFGQLMIESHTSLRDDYDVTGVELDTLVASALTQEGVLGARMTGAGMGGCAIALVHEDYIQQVKAQVNEDYYKKIGYAPSFYVAELGDGVREITR